MTTLQGLIQDFLSSAGFSLLDTRDGFVLADKLGFGGDRDTRLLWITPPPVEVRDFREQETRLLKEFERAAVQYPQAKPFLVAETLEGFSRDFRSEAIRRRVGLNVPVQFFDAPYRIEEAPEAASAMKSIVEAPTTKRVPQPYHLLDGHEFKVAGEDLVVDLFGEMRPTRTARASHAKLRIVVGEAGAGKSVFFQALFKRIYDHFQTQKQKQHVSSRPVPLIPDYLRQASGLRTQALIDSFLRTDVAAPVPAATFEWLLVHGFTTWLFDGVDELYAGDPDFFEFLIELITRPQSQAQILLCARSSLLTSSEALARLLADFPPGLDNPITVFRLADWDHKAKRTFAWLNLEGRPPSSSEPDPQRVETFLRALNSDASLKALSGLPYYCSLLLEQYREGQLDTSADELALLDTVISHLVNREVAKGLLSPDLFERDGLQEWLQTVACLFFKSEAKGIAAQEAEQYAQFVLRTGLADDVRRNATTSLVQFPLFAPGSRPGVMTFKHELVAEYLAGLYLLRRIAKDPCHVARELGTRIDLADSLILRVMARQLTSHQGANEAIVKALQTETLPGHAFGNLLQLAMLASPSATFVKDAAVPLEGRDLKHVQFRRQDLSGVSFRNCDLSSTGFRACDLQGALFEGAILAGTRFQDLEGGKLRGAHFGNMERMEFFYVSNQRFDEPRKAAAWVAKATGSTEAIEEPCAAAMQLRALLGKFISPDGSGRRDELVDAALVRGKRYEGGPEPKDCVWACQRFGYLNQPDMRGRIRRASGDMYNDLVLFVRDWRLTTGLRQLLDSLCRTRPCDHVPRNYRRA